jgi:hypothetical protein
MTGIVLAELTLIASDPFTVYITEALRKCRGEYIPQIW